MTRKPGPKPYPVRIRGVDYPSPAAAAAHFGLSVGTVRNLIARGRADSIGLGRGRHPGSRASGRPPKPVTFAGVEFSSRRQFQREAIGYKCHRRMQPILTAGADERVIGRLMRKAITVEQRAAAKRVKEAAQ